MKRADEAAARAADAQRQSAEATAQAKEWAATVDKRVEEAARLRAAGKTEDADIMKSRAQRATDAAVEQQLRASELDRDVEAFNAQANTYRTEAAQLATQADLLDEEAATLSASAKAADTEADKLQARADAQDRIADDIDARLASGVATTIRIKDDVEGTDVTIQIPGRPPTEDDLPTQPGGQPSSQPSSSAEPPADSPNATADGESVAAMASAQHVSMEDFDTADAPDQFVAAAAPTFEESVEPQQDFAPSQPEPDSVDTVFDGMGGDDYAGA